MPVQRRDIEGYLEKPASGRYEPDTFRARHRAVVRLHVAGRTNREIAELLGLAESTVSQILNSTEGLKHIRRLSGELDKHFLEVQAELQALSPLALDVLEDILLDPDQSTTARIVVAKDILDRAGHKPVQRVQAFNAQIDADFIRAIRERAEELRQEVTKANAVVIDDSKEEVSSCES